jgi:hypothetical protein
MSPPPIVSVEYRFLYQGRQYGLEDQADIATLAEIIGMPGHPLGFQTHLDGQEVSQFKGEAN